MLREEAENPSGEDAMLTTEVFSSVKMPVFNLTSTEIPHTTPTKSITEIYG